jgi:hypothetical protein
VTGNIATSGNFVGNGSALTGITASTANAASFLIDPTAPGVNVSVSNAFSLLNFPQGGYIGWSGDGVDPNTGGSLDIVPGGNVANAYASLTFLNPANVFANPISTVNVSNIGMVFKYDFLGTFGGTRTLQLDGSGMSLDTTFSATGNITTAANFVGNGAALTGIVSSYGNANVAANLAAFGSNPISTTGNITSGNSNVTNTLYASNITGAAGQNVTITADGTGDIHLDADSIRVGDNNSPVTIVTHGTGNLILRTHEGDASQGNITLVNGANGNIQLNPNGTGQVTTTTISATGNVTGNYFLGNGSALTGITASTANSATFLTSSSNAAAHVSVDSANTQTVLPGNGRIGYGGDGVDPNTFGSVDIIPAQTNLANAYSALTFVNLANFAANPINTVNVSNTAAFMSYDLIGTAKTLTVSSAGVAINTTLSATGNITTAGNFVGNGAALTGIVSTYGNANVTTLLGAFGSNTISTTGNVTSGNLQTTSLTGTTISVSSTVIGGNLQTPGFASAVGNIIGGNVLSGGAITATAGISTGTTVSAVGNIIGGNITTGGAVSTSGRVIGANYTETVHAIGSSGGTITPNISLGSIQSITLTSNMTFSSITNINAGQSFTFIVTQDGTGSRTLTSTMKFAGNSRTLSTAANSIDIISVFYNGSTYFASLTKGYA